MNWIRFEALHVWHRIVDRALKIETWRERFRFVSPSHKGGHLIGKILHVPVKVPVMVPSQTCMAYTKRLKSESLRVS